MTNLIKICAQSQYIVVQETQLYGGVDISIDLSPDAKQLLDWVKKHRETVEKEEKLRQTVPALANQWEQYQTMLKIVMDDV